MFFPSNFQVPVYNQKFVPAFQYSTKDVKEIETRVLKVIGEYDKISVAKVRLVGVNSKSSGYSKTLLSLVLETELFQSEAKVEGVFLFNNSHFLFSLL